MLCLLSVHLPVDDSGAGEKTVIGYWRLICKVHCCLGRRMYFCKAFALFGVHSGVKHAARHIPNIDFTRLQVKRCEAEASTFFEKTDTIGRYVLFCVGGGVHRSPADDIQRLAGDLCM